MSAFERLKIDPAAIDLFRRVSSDQIQTKEAFGFKWSRRDTYESDAVKAASKAWLFERYCGNDPAVLAGWFAGESKIILDAGCGAGFSALLLFGEYLKRNDYLGVDISSSVEVAEQRFKEAGYPGDFLQCDLMNIPITDSSVDIIFSEGVLHHTDSTERAIHYLAEKLKPGGRFMFYVYARKAAIREFTDDYVRKQLIDLSDEEAWNALEPLTKLGMELGRLNCEIDVPEDIPYLGIKRGRINLQRFFYWNICKMYYRPDWSLEEMNHVNFDWFRPINCHRQTPKEVFSWVQDAGLVIEHSDIQESGITVVARKSF